MKTGLESLDTGASKITYSGNEGPKAPMKMAMADPLLEDEYQKYVFEMEEQGLQPMSFEEFRLQAMSGMAEGGVAIQGGGPNYLGKQKEVKVPVKWKSSPDHPDTELAYITEPEKEVLIALNMHGGLEDGKPNKGPKGVISLQGDMGSISGRSGNNERGNGSSNREQYISQMYSPPPKAPTPTPQETNRERAIRAMTTTGSSYTGGVGDPEPA